MVVARDVDQALQRAVNAGVAPGVVALAADDEGVIYAGASGARGIGAAAPPTTDTTIWVSSPTKKATSVPAPIAIPMPFRLALVDSHLVE